MFLYKFTHPDVTQLTALLTLRVCYILYHSTSEIYSLLHFTKYFSRHSCANFLIGISILLSIWMEISKLRQSFYFLVDWSAIKMLISRIWRCLETRFIILLNFLYVFVFQFLRSILKFLRSSNFGSFCRSSFPKCDTKIFNNWEMLSTYSSHFRFLLFITLIIYYIGVNSCRKHDLTICSSIR